MIDEPRPVRQRGRRRHAAARRPRPWTRPPAGSISASRACTTRVPPRTTSRPVMGERHRRAHRAVAGLRELAAQVGGGVHVAMSDTAPTPPETGRPAGAAARPAGPAAGRPAGAAPRAAVAAARRPRSRPRPPRPSRPRAAAPPEPPKADAPPPQGSSDDGPKERPGAAGGARAAPRGVGRPTSCARASPAPATTRRRRPGSSDDGPQERPEPPADPAPAHHDAPADVMRRASPPPAAAATSPRGRARAAGRDPAGPAAGRGRRA